MTDPAGGRRAAADEEAPGCAAVVAVRTPAAFAAACQDSLSFLAEYEGWYFAERAWA